MSTGPKGKVAKQYPTTGKRGGYRPGAGRKPGPTLSAYQVEGALRKAQQRAKAEKKDIDDVLLDHIYCDNRRDSLAAIKLWKDFTSVKLTEGGEADRELGPQVYLPEADPDPAKVVPIRGEQSH